MGKYSNKTSPLRSRMKSLWLDSIHHVQDNWHLAPSSRTAPVVALPVGVIGNVLSCLSPDPERQHPSPPLRSRRSLRLFLRLIAADSSRSRRRQSDHTGMLPATTVATATGGPSSCWHRRRHHRQQPLQVPFKMAQLGLLLIVAAAGFGTTGPKAPVVEAMPLQLKIRHGEKECFLESLTAGCVRTL